MEENGLTLLKQEMANEEIHIKVNAIHRLKTVILSIGLDETIATLIPYIDGKYQNTSHEFSLELIKSEDDEVLFAVAEELGKVFPLIPDKTVFLPSLETLAKKDETVVREQAAKSLTTISENLSDAEI